MVVRSKHFILVVGMLAGACSVSEDPARIDPADDTATGVSAGRMPPQRPRTAPGPLPPARPDEASAVVLPEKKFSWSRSPDGGDGPDALLGLTEAELIDLIGPPEERRESPPSRTWVYALPTCRLEISMFPDVRTNVYYSLAYSFQATAENTANDRECVGQFRRKFVGTKG